MLHHVVRHLIVLLQPFYVLHNYDLYVFLLASLLKGHFKKKTTTVSLNQLKNVAHSLRAQFHTFGRSFDSYLQDHLQMTSRAVH